MHTSTPLVDDLGVGPPAVLVDRCMDVVVAEAAPVGGAFTVAMGFPTATGIVPTLSI